MSFQFPFAGVMGWGNTEHLPGGFSEDNLNFTTLENVPALATDASRSNTLQPTQAQDSGSDPRATLPKGTKRRRGRNKDLDWDGVKPHLRRLYLPRKPGQKAKILDDIMKIMEEKHSFRATPKMYKDMFKSWGWRKNLPADVAHFMVHKANEVEKQYPDKAIFFKYGGQTWTKGSAILSLNRATKKNDVPNPNNMKTPAGLRYVLRTKPTETDTMSSKRATESTAGQELIEISSSSSSPSPESLSETSDSDTDTDSTTLALTWRGRTTKDLHELFNSAKAMSRRGDTQAAEQSFKQVLRGYKRLLSPTHEDTAKVATALATFYVEHDRIPEAYAIIEDNLRWHIEDLGIGDRKTQQRISNVVELFNGWNRQDDALALLARTKALLRNHNPSGRSEKHARVDDITSHGLYDFSLLQQPFDMSQAIGNVETGDFTNAIGIARMSVIAGDESVETLLLAIIRQCRSNATTFVVERLQAWTELVKLYQKLDTVNGQFVHMNSAKEAFDEVMSTYPWAMKTRERFKVFQVMEACLELAAAFLKAGYDSGSSEMFDRAQDKASNIFGWNDERTIWTNISIGLLYQRYRGWDLAKIWFQAALSAARDRYDSEDGVRISLEEAIENGHFSYVNDEGRPFKTIFGVTGLTIRPNRLHLE